MHLTYLYIYIAYHKLVAAYQLQTPTHVDHINRSKPPFVLATSHLIP